MTVTGDLLSGRVPVGAPGAALATVLAAAVLSACAAGPSPADFPAGEPLPPPPEVRGEPAPRVVYPDSLDRIAVRDSNFIFGTVGTGDAELTIDGIPVEVEPNGAFLAWLPVPEPARGDTAVYLLVVRTGPRVDTLRHRIRVPVEPDEDDGRVRAAPESPVWIEALPGAGLPVRWALPDEEVRLRFRAAPGLTVRVRAGPDDEATYATEAAEESPGRYVVRARAGELREPVPAERLRRDDPDASPRPPLRLETAATDGADTARTAAPWPLEVLDRASLPVAELREEVDPVHGASGVVPGRALPRGGFHWLFPTGTVAVVDGRRGDRVRIRLAPDLHAWVNAEEAGLTDAAGSPPESVVGDLAVEPLEDRLRLRIPLGERLPSRVDSPDPGTLRLTLYGARGATGRIAHGPSDPLLDGVEWEQLPGLRYRLAVRLHTPVWGWRTRWEEGSGGWELVLDVRRPPALEPNRPLEGRRVAVDPGHPPLGATGPTGLREADANLAVARRLVELLREEGAEPILVREDTAAVGLYERRHRAVEAGAELLVSIHNDALPDGVRPFGREGTSTYYFHPHSRDLAHAVQTGMLRWMGLRDRGVFWGSLAVIRETWLPAVLTEGAFMMFPRHEAALRTPEFREAYARGVLEGIEGFLEERARAGR